eukprot:g2251.t1
MNTPDLGNLAWFGCLWAAVHAVAARAIKIWNPPSFTQRDRDTFPNRCVATLNALVVGLPALLRTAPQARLGSSLRAPLEFSNEHVLAFGDFEALHCDIQLSYMLFDTFWLASRGKVEKDLVAHHVLGLASWLTVRATQTGGFYMVWTHTAELSTPFLHASWLLFKLGRQQTRAFWVASRGTIVMFLVFRVLSVFACLAHMVAHGDAAFAAAGSAVRYYQLLTMVAFWGINLLWFSLLIKMAVTDKIREPEDKFDDKSEKKAK